MIKYKHTKGNGIALIKSIAGCARVCAGKYCKLTNICLSSNMTIIAFRFRRVLVFLKLQAHDSVTDALVLPLRSLPFKMDLMFRVALKL